MFPLDEISCSDRLLVAGVVFRRLQEGSADWMARASNAARAGLDVDLTQQRDGTWKIVLKDDQGQVVYDRTYGTEWTAKDKARRWVRANYLVDTQESISEPIRKPQRKPPYTNKAPSAAHLARLLALRADSNEEKAIALRTQADALETEAKRLREAADTLGDPYGQT